jgi:hypothetical protein
MCNPPEVRNGNGSKEEDMAGKQGAAVRRVAGLRYWRAAEARVVVEAWRHSGQTLSEFAGRYGIQARRLGRWAGQLEPEEEAVRFHPVRLVARQNGEGRSGEPIEIVLGDGRRVRVPRGFAAEDLERVLSVLARGAGC